MIAFEQLLHNPDALLEPPKPVLPSAGLVSQDRNAKAGGSLLRPQIRAVVLLAHEIFVVRKRRREELSPERLQGRFMAQFIVLTDLYEEFVDGLLRQPRVCLGAPAFLLSEALRGEGALLVDSNGRDAVAPLLPRDVVARAITRHRREKGPVFLSLRHIGPRVRTRFAAISRELEQYGLDLATERARFARYQERYGVKSEVAT